MHNILRCMDMFCYRIYESLCSMEEEELSGGVADTTSQHNLNGQ